MATAEAQRKWRAKKRLAAAASRKLDQAIDAAQASRELYTPSKNQAGLTPISTLPKPKHSVRRMSEFEILKERQRDINEAHEAGLAPAAILSPDKDWSDPKPKHSVSFTKPPPLDIKRVDGSSVWDNLEGGLPSRRDR